ncbi:Uncharacterised protein [Mycobacteroides abscessus subsp. abscessus]|nr:Uncharacterised protein [Mycobacteroides abscessus subsp. abscessus]
MTEALTKIFRWCELGDAVVRVDCPAHTVAVRRRVRRIVKRCMQRLIEEGQIVGIEALTRRGWQHGRSVVDRIELGEERIQVVAVCDVLGGTDGGVEIHALGQHVADRVLFLADTVLAHQ